MSGHTSPGSRPRPMLGTTAESDPWRRFSADDAEKQMLGVFLSRLLL